MTKTAAAALALAIGALAMSSQADAQAMHLPKPPMIHDVRYPDQPFCFKDQAEAISWTNAGYGLLSEVVHDRQAAESYVRALQLAEVGLSADLKPYFDREITFWQNQIIRLDLRARHIQDLIKGARDARYCPPPKVAIGPRPPKAVLIGSTNYEGRMVSVYDNKNGSHTVVTEVDGRTTSEVHPNGSGR